MAETTALTDVTALVREELDEVAHIVHAALEPESPELRGLLDHAGRFRGKQLRPALVLLAAKAVGEVQPAHLTIAAVVEMLHAATLVHDDILDGAGLRRGLPTIHAVSGAEVAVLLGDYLYAKAFHMAVALDDPRCSRVLSETVRVICQGEMTQMVHRFDADLSEAKYFEIIRDKTAVLYGASSRLGAAYAGADADVAARFQVFGDQLGLAFQIVDDILDVDGDEAVVGKSLGTDFGKGKLTLPFLWMLDRAGAVERRRFVDLYARHATGDVSPIDTVAQRRLLEGFDLPGGVRYAHERADECLRTAVESLAGLPSNPAVDALRSMADYVLHRQR
ncbi:MAG: polyprenyl synthetase family protein [Planctomycetes bacterium]|nr:polyprenyl synthetase family protein [Planctomycetota bacterium]MCB9918650.1 polyprenyl synthetase family protein [Planctomycetota bacterium]